jgi:hypothetical protein
MRRLGVPPVRILMAISAATAARAGYAQTRDAAASDAVAATPKRPGFWERVTFDLGYEVSFSHENYPVDFSAHDPTTQQQTDAILFVDHVGAAHGIVLSAAFSVAPWLGVGVDGLVQQDFTAPTHPWLEHLGLRLGRRRAAGLGVFAEYRPWQHGYTPLQGWFFRFGARWLWIDRQMTQSPEIVSNARDFSADLYGWASAGYRVHQGSSLSWHLLVDAGVSVSFASYVGIRVGGGLH